MAAHRSIRIEPVTPGRWDDLVRLFGARGACGGCWCMTPRLSSAEYERSKGAGNRRKLRALVDRGRVPGVLAYRGDEPVGWCSIEPREAFPRLARSRICKPVDDAAAWSITCLFVAKGCRAQGMSSQLIAGAVDHARRNGARIVEAYPVEPKRKPMPDVFAFTGIASAFRRLGFVEVARRSPSRPFLRRALERRAS